jgi:hypothetical protein
MLACIWPRTCPHSQDPAYYAAADGVGADGGNAMPDSEAGELGGLAEAAAGALLAAMTTDEWEQVKARFTAVVEHEADMERDRAALVAVSQADLARERAARADQWAEHFRTVLRDDPDAVEAVRELVSDLTSSGAHVSAGHSESVSSPSTERKRSAAPGALFAGVRNRAARRPVIAVLASLTVLVCISVGGYALASGSPTPKAGAHSKGGTPRKSASPTLVEDSPSSVVVSLAPATGGWTVQVLPKDDPYTLFVPNGISCASPDQCTAYGMYRNSAAAPFLYDGVRWRIGAYVDDNKIAAGIWPRACPAADACWAYGGSTDAPFRYFDGSSWKPIASSDSLPPIFRVDSIACPSTTNCWAVAEQRGQPLDGPSTFYLLAYDGTSWSDDTAALNLPDQIHQFGVMCTGVSDCWLLGGPPSSVIEHYDGTSWSERDDLEQLFPSTRYPSESDYCRVAGDCWFTDGLTMVHLNGDQVTQYPLPWDADVAAIPDFTADVAVTCPSATDCWAYGSEGSYGSLVSAPVLAHWTGDAWESEVDNLNLPSGRIAGIACPTPTECALYGQVVYGRNGDQWVPFAAVHR